MSDFEFDCPHCKQCLKASYDMSGQLVECPSCANTIEVPFERQVRQQAIIKEVRQNKKTKTNLKTKICQFCGETIPNTATKCRHCQSDLINKESNDIKGETISNYKKCPKCQEKILQAATKCRYCGSDLSIEANLKEMGKAMSSVGCGLIIFAVILPILFFAGC